MCGLYLPILDSFLLAVIVLVYNDLYGTPPCSMPMLGMYTHASTSDYLLFTRFFFTTSFQGYWNAASINDRPSLNTTAGERDIEYLAGFR